MTSSSEKVLTGATRARILFSMDEKETHDRLFKNAPAKAQKLIADHRKQKRLKERREYKERFLNHGLGQKQD